MGGDRGGTCEAGGGVCEDGISNDRMCNEKLKKGLNKILIKSNGQND